MSYDWLNFFQQHGVQYSTEGKNVKRGWVNVKCPWCGSSDTGFHLGCNPETGGYACWRDSTHKGRSVPKLIDALLGCGWRRACELAGDWKEPTPIEAGDLARQVAALDDEPIRNGLPVIKFPPADFPQLTPRFASHWNYVVGRGFKEEHVADLVDLYRLRACTTGEWRGRVILPFLGARDRVHGWQGRAIDKGATLRYRSYPSSETVKRVLFNAGPVTGPGRKRVLAVVEGPIGCLKVDFYGYRHGIRAVGTLGANYTHAQVSEVYRLAPAFDQVLVLFDPGAEGQALNLAGHLAGLQPVIGQLPADLTGPDDLNRGEIADFVNSCL